MFHCTFFLIYRSEVTENIEIQTHIHTYLFTFTVCATTTDREGKERERKGGTGVPECDERKREYTRLIHQGCTISVTTAIEKK